MVRGFRKNLLRNRWADYWLLNTRRHTIPRAGKRRLVTGEVMSADIESIVALVRQVRHDANNPLTAALGNVQLMLDDPALLDPDVRANLSVIEGELRRLTQILARLNEVKAPGS